MYQQFQNANLDYSKFQTSNNKNNRFYVTNPNSSRLDQKSETTRPATKFNSREQSMSNVKNFESDYYPRV